METARCTSCSASPIAAATLPASDTKSATFLEARLARYQAQLSDWTHCVSAKTPEGKAKIKDLSDKVAATTADLDAARRVEDRRKADVRAEATDGSAAGSVARVRFGLFEPRGTQVDVYA